MDENDGCLWVILGFAAVFVSLLLAFLIVLTFNLGNVWGY